MRQTLRLLFTTTTLSALVAGCVAYVPSRHGSGHHGHRDCQHDHDWGGDRWDRGRWERDRWNDGRRDNRSYR